MFWLARLIKFARPIPPTPRPRYSANRSAESFLFPTRVSAQSSAPRRSTARLLPNKFPPRYFFLFAHGLLALRQLAPFILIDTSERRHQESLILLEMRDTTAMFIHMFAFRLKPGITEAQQERMIREIGDLRNSSRWCWNHTSAKMFRRVDKASSSAA